LGRIFEGNSNSFTLFNGFNFGEFSDGGNNFAAFTNDFTHVAGVNGKSNKMRAGFVDSFFNGEAVRMVNDGGDNELN